MVSCKKSRQRGVTLVELMIGITIFIFVMVSGYLVLSTVTKGETTSTAHTKVIQKLQNAAEEIRQMALLNFSSMTVTDLQNLEAYKYDDKIQIVPQIMAVDQQTRTREVRLTATWKDGLSVSSKTLTFYLAPLRGKLSGGKVKVYVDNGAQPGVGIAGVKITAKGQDISEVWCETDEEGSCQINGAQLVSDLIVKYDGTSIAYFHDSGLDKTLPSATWISSFTLTETVTPTGTVYFHATMYPLGAVQGNVIDAVALEGAPNVVVALRPSSGKVAMADSTDLTSLTDVDGKFSFSKVMPGRYSIHVIGSVEDSTLYPVYAGVAKQGDDEDNEASRVFFNVLPGSLVKFQEGEADPFTPLKTVRRGSLQINLQNISKNLDSLSTINFPAGIQVNAKNIYVAGVSSGMVGRPIVYAPNFMDMTHSLPYKEFYFRGSKTYPQFANFLPTMSTVAISDSGIYTFNHIGPAVVSSAYAMNLQSSRVLVLPPQMAPPPYIPVLVKKINPLSSWLNPNLQFQIRVFSESLGTDFSIFSPYSAAPTVSINSFMPTVTTNQTSTGNDFYILKEDHLANVNGTLVGSDGFPFYAGSSGGSLGLTYSVVSVEVGDGGFGGVKQGASIGNYVSDLYAVATNLPPVNWTIDSSRDHLFNSSATQCMGTGDPTRCLGLVPNLGSDTTRIKYYAIGTPLYLNSQNHPINLNLLGFEKQKIGNTISTVTLSPGLVDIENLVVESHVWTGSPFVDLNTITINNSSASYIPTHAAENKYYLDKSCRVLDSTFPAVDIEPCRVILGSGQTHLLKITVGGKQYQWTPFLVRLIDATGSVSTIGNEQPQNWAFKPSPPGDTNHLLYYNSAPLPGWYASPQPLEVYRKVHLILTGQVKDQYGAAVVNTAVSLIDPNDSVIAQTTTDSMGQYSFTGASPLTSVGADPMVVPYVDSPWDVKIRVTASGAYTPAKDFDTQVYNQNVNAEKASQYRACQGGQSCMVIAQDFTLNKVLSGGTGF